MNIEQEMKSAAQQLMMSPTLERLWMLSQSGITDVHSKEDLKIAFSTCGAELMGALDNNRIHFDSKDDKAMFYALLVVITDFVMDGHLKTCFTESVIN